MGRIKHRQAMVKKCGIINCKYKTTGEQRKEWGMEQGILYKNPSKGYSTTTYPEGTFKGDLISGKLPIFKRHLVKSNNHWKSLIKSLYKLLEILNIKFSPEKEITYTTTVIHILRALYRDIDYKVSSLTSVSLLLAYSIDDRFYKTKEHNKCLDKIISIINTYNNKSNHKTVKQ